MTQQAINLGTLSDGSDGDTNKVAWGKANDNFSELYGLAPYDTGNLLINAAGAINQRGYVSGTATTAANQYTVDRWKVLTLGQNLAWTMAGGIATFTAPAGGVAQVVEGSSIQDGTYVLSWEGTATATVGGAAVTNGTPFTLSAGVDTSVVFSGGTFSKPQLRMGSAVKAFAIRPFAVEVQHCKRYFQKSFALGDTPADNTEINFVDMKGYGANSVLGLVNFACLMRAAPTITYYSATAGASPTAGQWQAYRSAYGWVSTTGISTFHNSESQFSYIASLASAADMQSYYAQGNWTADAEL